MAALACAHQGPRDEAPVAAGEARSGGHAPERHGPHRHSAHPHSGHAHHGPAQHRFDDPEKWSKVFDDPARNEWQKPAEVVRELRLGPDETVADVGAGTGYFLGWLSKAVPEGRVYGIDIEPKLVDWMRARAEKEGLPNVETVLALPDDPKIPDSTDVVLLVNTYHHLQKRADYFARVREKLSSRGRVVIVDFKMGDLPVGPPDTHKIPPDVIEREMREAGLKACRRYDDLPYQHLLVFAVSCE